MIRLEPLAQHADDAIDALLDAAFGADRRARPAYAIRRGMAWLTGFSYAAVSAEGAMLGLLQSWPVALDQPGGGQVPLVMVGPVAVLPDRQGDGIGRAMMDRLIADVEQAAALTGCGDPLMMIGDEPYYGRFWNFRAEPTRGWDVPAGVDAARLLARPAAAGMAPVPSAGRLGPRRAEPVCEPEPASPSR